MIRRTVPGFTEKIHHCLCSRIHPAVQASARQSEGQPVEPVPFIPDVSEAFQYRISVPGHTKRNHPDPGAFPGHIWDSQQGRDFRVRTFPLPSLLSSVLLIRFIPESGDIPAYDRAARFPSLSFSDQGLWKVPVSGQPVQVRFVELRGDYGFRYISPFSRFYKTVVVVLSRKRLRFIQLRQRGVWGHHTAEYPFGSCNHC